MIKINNALLIELGLDALPAHLKKLMLKQIHESLQLRVGRVLAGQMTGEQLDEFEEFMKDGEDGEALSGCRPTSPIIRKLSRTSSGA